MKNFLIIQILIFFFCTQCISKGDFFLLRTPTNSPEKKLNFEYTSLGTRLNLRYNNRTEDTLWEISSDLSSWFGLNLNRSLLISTKRPYQFLRLVNTGKRVPEIYIPSDYNKSFKYPLILNLHGYSGNSSYQNLFFDIQELADKYGFIFCTPNGVRDLLGLRSWNATDACCGYSNNSDDSSYLEGLINSAINRFSIDKNKIYITGLSNGAFMSYRMAYDHSNLIAAIVPFAGVGYKNWPKKPKFPVSILHIHGTSDTVISYNGGFLGFHEYPGAIENFEEWRKFNECDRKISTKIRLDITQTVSGRETKRVRYENEDGTVISERWDVINGSHIPTPSKKGAELIINWLVSISR